MANEGQVISYALDLQQCLEDYAGRYSSGARETLMNAVLRMEKVLREASGLRSKPSSNGKSAPHKTEVIFLDDDDDDEIQCFVEQPLRQAARPSSGPSSSSSILIPPESIGGMMTFLSYNDDDANGNAITVEKTAASVAPASKRRRVNAPPAAVQSDGSGLSIEFVDDFDVRANAFTFSPTSCDNCGKALLPDKYLEAGPCHHALCQQCVQMVAKRHITLQKLETGKFPCPVRPPAFSSLSSSSAPSSECKGFIVHSSAAKMLDTFWSQRLDKVLLQLFFAGNDSYVHCPSEGCENVMEKIPEDEVPGKKGGAAMIEKDADGKVLSAESIAHRDRYRLRCSACASNFCTSCKALPYHLGRTCEAAEAHKAAVKCRFCGVEMVGNSGGGDDVRGAAAAAAVPLLDEDDEEGASVRFDSAGAYSSSDGAGAASAATASAPINRRGRGGRGGGKSVRGRGGKAASAAAASAAASSAAAASSSASAASAPLNFNHGLPDVCRSPECVAHAWSVCRKTLPCGHACCGVAADAACRACLPCLQPDCVASSADVDQMIADDYCNICFTEGLGAAPCVQLKCKHIFHEHCIKKKMAASWPGARMTFDFMNCSLCKASMEHAALASVLAPAAALRASVEGMAAQRLKHEGLQKDPLIVSRFKGDALAFAMDRFAYYPCFKCKKPYFGGMRACGDAAAANAAAAAGGGAANGAAAVGGDAAHLLCPGCQPVPPGVSVCAKHGKDFLSYKCRYCCGAAVWHCWGTTRFCDKCHDMQVKGTGWWLNAPKVAPVCTGPSSCPLRCAHPPNGEEYSLGCEQCRSESAVGY